MLSRQGSSTDLPDVGLAEAQTPRGQLFGHPLQDITKDGSVPKPIYVCSKAIG